MQKDIYTINLREQQTPVASYQWTVGDDFFAATEDAQIQQGTVNVELQSKQLAGGQYDLFLNLEGEVTVPCDRCLEPMRQAIKGSATLRVRLGDQDSDDGEVIEISEARGTIDLRWHVYEQIALSLPLRHVHPDGECPGDAADTLARYAAPDEDAEAEQTADPRWDALKGILDKQ